MKNLRLTSESQGQQYDLPIDLNTIPRFFETDQDLERRLRKIALTRAEDLSIVDLMKFHSPAVALSIFVKQLYEVLHKKRLDKHNVNEKMFRVLKNESKLHKFNMEI
jgi:UDP-galactopyranose mutase